MTWVDGGKLLAYKTCALEERNRIAKALFRAWWYPFSHYAVIHGDPHLGNYTIIEEDGRASGINLLDYGCIRTFHPKFVGGVIDLYHGIRTHTGDLIVHAYETWGFRGLSNDLIDVLNIWAGFIYGPLLDDRVRPVADGVAPNEYGRREVYRVHMKEKGPVEVLCEFVFMDRAAIGLGAVFLHLAAEMNFYQLFNEVIERLQARRDRGPPARGFRGVGRATAELARAKRCSLPVFAMVKSLMIENQIDIILKRVRLWPRERQREAAEILALMEEQDTSPFQLSDEQLAEVHAGASR